MLNNVENRQTKTFDEDCSQLRSAIGDMGPIPSEHQMMPINVSILCANSDRFLVIVCVCGGGTHPHTNSRVSEETDSQKGFCYGNEALRLHLSTNKDSFHSVHSPVKWTFLFVRGGGSRLHNMLSSPRYVMGAFGFVVRLHVQNMN